MKTAILVCAKPSGFSGQRFASELLEQGLRRRGWSVRMIDTPALNRATRTVEGEPSHALAESSLAKLSNALKLALSTLAAWISEGRAAFSDKDVLHVNLAQTKFGLLRDGFPLLIRRVFSLTGRAVVSLHGSLFMTWSYDCVEARLLRSMVKAARYITVLGPTQRQRLVNLGIPAEKILLVDNSCTISSISEQECIDKQLSVGRQQATVLYFSNLIETKGYVEFLEAVRKLAYTTDMAFEAILCGSITVVEASRRFPSSGEPSAWIRELITEVNQSRLVRLRWIDGASGTEKQDLFRKAQVFVLPTRYSVEAQPIVILEALSSGCAVVATKVGEIPNTVSGETAVLLDQVSIDTVAAAIAELLSDQDKRLRLALNGSRLFRERFAYEAHIDKWEEILTAVSKDL